MAHEPISITLENGPEKLPGFIMKISPTGMLIELDKITFKIGSFLTAQFTLENEIITERVRSIKHYDRYFRNPPKGKPKEGEPVPVPKKLAEVHFQMLNELNRVAITKYMLKQKPEVVEPKPGKK